MRSTMFAVWLFIAAASAWLGGCDADTGSAEVAATEPDAAEEISPHRLAGAWQGTLDVGVAELRLVLELEHGETGLTGQLVSEDQGGARMALSEVRLEGRAFRFASTAPAFSYSGEVVSEDRISGVFTQNGQDFALDFEAQSSSPVEAVAASEAELSPGEEETAVEVADAETGEAHRLTGILRRPDGQARAGVVILSGSGPQDRDGRMAGQSVYAAWAALLAENGVASLRLDDRGVGGSDRIIPQSPNDLSLDAVAALDHLRVRTALNCVGYLGHSEGGWIALLAAPDAEPDFIISMAGMHEAMEPTLVRQSEAIIRASGGGDAAVEANRTLQDAMFEVLRTALPEDDVTGRLEAALLEAGAPAGVAESQAAIWGQPYAVAAFQMDPAEAARRYEGPVLALFGETDTQVLAEPTSALLVESRPGADTRTVTIEGVDHLFQDSATGAPGAYGSAGHALSPTAAQVLALEINTLVERSCR
jgi:pimeloyl-ACP methyl ester carboxylesterase